MTGRTAAVATVRAIGINQIFGGVLILVSLISAQNQGSSLSDAFLYTGHAYGLMAIVSGIGLLAGSRFGRRSGLVLQALSVVGVTGPTFSWLSELGAQLQVELSTSTVEAHIGFGGKFALWPPIGASREPTLWFDVIALLSFLVLWKFASIPSAGAEPVPSDFPTSATK